MNTKRSPLPQPMALIGWDRWAMSPGDRRQLGVVRALLSAQLGARSGPQTAPRPSPGESNAGSERRRSNETTARRGTAGMSHSSAQPYGLATSQNAEGDDNVRRPCRSRGLHFDGCPRGSLWIRASSFEIAAGYDTHLASRRAKQGGTALGASFHDVTTWLGPSDVGAFRRTLRAGA